MTGVVIVGGGCAVLFLAPFMGDTPSSIFTAIIGGFCCLAGLIVTWKELS
jgi:hypothetical protein